MHIEPKIEARREDAKEWAAITLCIASALSTYFFTVSGGFAVGPSIALSFAVWILVGSWLANWFRPWDRKIFSGSDRFKTVPPLSKTVLYAGATMFAAYALYALSKVFI